MSAYVDISAVRSSKILELNAYWERLRAGRPMPSRSDIDPASIKPLLPFILISDVIQAPLRVRYRLVGTVVAQRSRQDFTGRYLDDLHFGSSEDWHGLYQKLLIRKTPIFGQCLMPLWQDQEPTSPYEYGAFPLSGDGTAIDGVIGLEDYDCLVRESAKPAVS